MMFLYSNRLFLEKFSDNKIKALEMYSGDPILLLLGIDQNYSEIVNDYHNNPALAFCIDHKLFKKYFTHKTNLIGENAFTFALRSGNSENIKYCIQKKVKIRKIDQFYYDCLIKKLDFPVYNSIEATYIFNKMNPDTFNFLMGCSSMDLYDSFEIKQIYDTDKILDVSLIKSVTLKKYPKYNINFESQFVDSDMIEMRNTELYREIKQQTLKPVQFINKAIQSYFICDTEIYFYATIDNIFNFQDISFQVCISRIKANKTFNTIKFPIGTKIQPLFNNYREFTILSKGYFKKIKKGILEFIIDGEQDDLVITKKLIIDSTNDFFKKLK